MVSVTRSRAAAYAASSSNSTAATLSQRQSLEVGGLTLIDMVSADLCCMMVGTYLRANHGHVQARAAVVRLRHNRPMRLRSVPVLAPLVVALLVATAGCDGESRRGAALPGLQQGAASVEWRGTLPCADCEGIDTLLVLQRGDDAQRYDLVEVYLAEEGSARFEEGGDWRLDGPVLALEPDTGGQRHFRVQPGGALQASDVEGRALAPGAGAVLHPTGTIRP